MALTRPRAAQVNFDVTNITDPLIRINSGQTGSNDKDSGIVIERGSDTNVAVIWDESADELAIVNTAEDGSTSGNVTISSYANVRANAFYGDGSNLTGLTSSYGDSDVASYLSANGYGTSSSIIASITDSAPGTLDTLNELAAALGDDANFSTTVTNSLATKLPLAGGTMTGSVTFVGGQTFDGRDVSADGAKLDGIESGATGDQTASEILTAIKTVDGSGSGLDADTLDGVQASSFLRSDADDTASGSYSFTNSYNEFGNSTGSVSNDGSWNARVNIAGSSHARLDVKSVSDGIITTMFSHTGHGAGKMGTYSNHPLILLINGADKATLSTAGSLSTTAQGTLWGSSNDGSGSGLDADLLDGMQPASTNTASTVVSRDASGNFAAGTITATATAAQYADLAEKYLADVDYPIGTVLEIGGDAEVTIASPQSYKIVGTVSEKPGLLMNSGLEGENVVPVAYIGRVPCRVQGNVNRGDFLVVGNTPGVAVAEHPMNILMGAAIGKALENHDSNDEGIIEILVGRL